MADKIVVSGKLGSGKLTGSLGNAGMSGRMSPSNVSVVTDYEGLRNKPQINGVTLSGNVTSQDLYLVSENTTAGWNENPLYLPKAGEICVYTDRTTVVDDQGHEITFSGIKIGDGNAYLIDLPFVGDDTRYMILQRIQQHEANAAIHVSPEDRSFWNNKLNYDVAEEELILNRL